MHKSYITHHHIISSLGFDSASNFNNLKKNKSGLANNLHYRNESFYTSRADKYKVNSEFSVIGNVDNYTDLEKMVILSVYQILNDSGLKISDKTGLIIATTKGNIDVLSPNSRFHKQIERSYLSELGKRVQSFFGFVNQPIVLSNACVSGILAIEVADKLIKSQLYDDVVVVSGDLVSEFVLSGFNSFQAISNSPCKPYSKNRTGISLGEAVASVLITKNKSNALVEVLGGASSNDANHISGPSRTGEGLVNSVELAMKKANVKAKDIDYISAHGTATMFNDEMEAIAFNRLGLESIPTNSLKGYYGHTLGASGLLETIIGIESLQNNLLIASEGFDELGVSKKLNIIKENKSAEINHFLKTSSGFGGCNCAVIFKRSV